MKVYSTIDDALRDAACAEFNGELRHRSTFKEKDNKGMYSHLCHDGRPCAFKNEQKMYDFCKYDEAIRRIPAKQAIIKTED
ncbi:MAG: hypothetical protein V1729_02895 [Candidatus Woesearchaeota archaeon]